MLEVIISTVKSCMFTLSGSLLLTIGKWWKFHENFDLEVALTTLVICRFKIS